MADDLRRERLKREARAPIVPPTPPAGSPAFVGRLTPGAYGAAPPVPTVGDFMTVDRLEVGGAETVGGAGAFAVAPGGPTPVLLLGPAAPGAADHFLCRSVGFRWVAETAGCHPTVVVTVQPCGSPERNALVTFTKDGSTVSGTTDTSGKVTVTFWSPGTWPYTVIPAGGTAGYGGMTGTAVVTCATTALTVSPVCTWPRVLTYLGSVAQAQSAFYFVNVPASSPEPPYTLTYGPRPADIPKELRLLFFSAPGGVHDPWFVTMPDTAWFSDPIPATVFGNPTNVYFYLWMQGCGANVMVIDAPYGVGYSGTNDTAGAGNNVYQYIQTSCDPFQMKFDLSHPPQITGTHGPDDIPGTSAVGQYCCPRTGPAGGCTCP